jgi:UDPglucose 6-dehydrogenase/GDP-mannose 6-dehydrogenase
MQILEAVLGVNERQPHKVTALLREHLGSLSGRRIAVLGLAFKPGTDDMRESPAIPIVNELLGDGAVVQAYDPAATAEAKKVFGERIHYADNLPAALEGAQAVAIVTRWDEFRAVPELVNRMKDPPLIVDGRRMLDKQSVPRYAGVGV